MFVVKILSLQKIVLDKFRIACVTDYQAVHIDQLQGVSFLQFGG